jgi:hypothetical protein
MIGAHEVSESNFIIVVSQVCESVVDQDLTASVCPATLSFREHGSTDQY